MKASDVLNKAAQHMRDRAATYDKPEGERSMEKTVAAFNAITGQDLTTAEGWEFMAVLKQVRAFQNPAKPHVDSLEDGPAYLALLAEEMTSGEKDHSSAPNGDGWIPWGGGNSPFGGDVVFVNYRTRDGEVCKHRVNAGLLRWSHMENSREHGYEYDIVAYRIAK
jgi:hypothetical protein